MFKAPNITGPRFRKNVKSILTKDNFKAFLKLHPHHNITRNTFDKVITTCSTKMWETTIKERDGISLPTGGTVFIGSVKIKKKNNYDIQASIKANAPIKHRNHNTDGYSAKVMYSPHLARVSGRDRSMWSFKAHRNYKRSLGKQYSKDWKKYILPVNLYAVVKEYHRHRERNYRQESTIVATTLYNEFDLN